MEQIFRSECSETITTTVTAWPNGRFEFAVSTRDGCQLFLTFDLAKEDAEAMARAILGIPELPVFNWEQCCADMRAQVALEALDVARDAKSEQPLLPQAVSA
jgi:hypothetical protein